MATQECSFSLNPLEGFRHCVDVVEESNSVYIGIALGWEHTCALLLNGAVSCWGATTYGEALRWRSFLTHTSDHIPKWWNDEFESHLILIMTS